MTHPAVSVALLLFLSRLCVPCCSNAVKFTSVGQVTLTVDAVMVVPPSLMSPTPGVAPLPVLGCTGIHGSEAASPQVQACFELCVECSDSGQPRSTRQAKTIREAQQCTEGTEIHGFCLNVNSGFCLLSLSGAGIGISEACQARLFTPFSQAHREINGKYGGTGLGLAISKSLVELLGGKIG
jgi:signal transduction histidine kinase